MNNPRRESSRIKYMKATSHINAIHQIPEISDDRNVFNKRPLETSASDAYNFYKIFNLFGNNEDKAIEFLQEAGILKLERFCLDDNKPCPNCLKNLNLITLKNCPIDSLRCHNILPYQKSSKSFRCQKKSHKKELRISVRNGTFFHGTTTKLYVLITMIYCFAHDISYIDTIRECRGLLEHRDWQSVGKSSIAAIFFKIREVLFLCLTTQVYTYKMGGPNKIIEVDETKVGHRKFERGRVVKGKWILGLVERGGNEFRCFHVMKRDKETLNKIITENVEEGSTIFTDGWKAYSDLGKKFNYRHGVVNHSKNFISPDGGTHTQKIESQWRVLKNFLIGKQHRIDLDLYLTEFRFKRDSRVNHKDVFMEVLKAISFVDNTVDLQTLTDVNAEMVSIHDSKVVEKTTPILIDEEDQWFYKYQNNLAVSDQWVQNVLKEKMDGVFESNDELDTMNKTL